MIRLPHPFVGRRRRSVYRKQHYNLTLFSKNFVFLNHVGYSTGLSCYFGYRLCVVKLNKFWNKKILSFPCLSGFSFVRRCSIIGLVVGFFGKHWLPFIVRGLHLWLQLRFIRAYKFAKVHAIKHPISMLGWHLTQHRFLFYSSIGKVNIFLENR